MTRMRARFLDGRRAATKHHAFARVAKFSPRVLWNNAARWGDTGGYFVETQRFADFIVHEAAHVFHNCKRHRVGLPEKRRQEWLLEIDFAKRETFAYACEAFSRVVEFSPKLGGRPGLIDECVDAFTPNDEQVDHDELNDILREAARARNGWKHILARCAPHR
ncbi:MAG: hypothetical protein ABI134_30965 [Byssovorax sp.]